MILHWLYSILTLIIVTFYILFINNFQRGMDDINLTPIFLFFIQFIFYQVAKKLKQISTFVETNQWNTTLNGPIELQRIQVSCQTSFCKLSHEHWHYHFAQHCFIWQLFTLLFGTKFSDAQFVMIAHFAYVIWMSDRVAFVCALLPGSLAKPRPFIHRSYDFMSKLGKMDLVRNSCHMKRWFNHRFDTFLIQDDILI